MKRLSWPCPAPLLLALLGAMLATAGCGFMSHEVTIDAINHPKKTGGFSYKIVIKESDSVQSISEVRQQVINCVKTALSGRGMFEAIPPARPELIIEVVYGVAAPHPKVQYDSRDEIFVCEKYLKLSARENTDGGAKRGEEIWSVNVSEEDESRKLEPVLPLLASAMIKYVGYDTKEEKTVHIKEGDVDITFVKKGM